MPHPRSNTFPAADAGNTNESLESEWQAVIDSDHGVDDPNNIANLRPNDVIGSANEVQDEDDLESEAATLTTTRRVIAAEDGIMEEMEEDLDNEALQFKKDLEELGEELPEDDLDLDQAA